MGIRLAYGKIGINIELPDHIKFDIIEPKWVEGIEDQKLAITDSLRNPSGCKPLSELAKQNNKIGIIFSDITRATPYNIILPPLLDELKTIPKENISFFCANGTHRPATQKELADILGENIVENYEIIQNDSGNPDLHKYIGTTKSGNGIYINKRILGCNLKILTGFIEPHFFAGFSGGGKSLIPGMAYVKTIKRNHSIRQLSKDNVTWGITEGNPLWEELTEAAEFAPGIFLLNVSLNKSKEITGVFSGDLRTAHKLGSQFVKESSMVLVDEPYDIVITSNSGYPLDLNVYQSIKGLSAAAQIIKKGGTIIIAAECWDGIPAKSDYEAILKSVSSVEELAGYVKQKEDELNDTWQIYYQVLIQQKANVFLFSETLDNETIRQTFLNPVDDIAGLLVELVRKYGSDARICIMPEGPQTIPYLL